MTTRDQENERIQRSLYEREAGVADLIEFYARIETVYVSASKALEEHSPVRASNSTNPG
ncbi:MAG: hypothetical protein JW753_05265 [Dehalococcoidia bacterium]|nr:hypothetical protein [Dehalococcoidia bacterium]